MRLVCEWKCVESRETAVSIVKMPVAGKRRTSSSDAPNISHIRENSVRRKEREREGEREMTQPTHGDRHNAYVPEACTKRFHDN